MTEAPPWTVLSERVVVRDGHFVDLRAERVQTANGTVLDPYWIMHLPDWVIVVALTPDDRMVLVRQWRQGVKQWVLEPPGGIMDPGEIDPCITGAREMLEETGYAAARLRLVTAYWTDTARQTNRLHVVLAEGASLVAPTAHEAAEQMSTVLLPISEVLAGLPHGILGQGLQIGGVIMALATAGKLSLREGSAFPETHPPRAERPLDPDN